MNRVAQLFPMHEIRADGMSPMLVILGPLTAERTMLIEEMVFPVVVHKAVGVVGVAVAWREVQLRPILLAHTLAGIALFEVVHGEMTQFPGITFQELDMGLRVARQVEQRMGELENGLASNMEKTGR